MKQIITGKGRGRGKELLFLTLTFAFTLAFASTAHAAPKLCLVWEQSVQTVGTAAPAETTRSKIFDTVADALAYLERRKIPDTSVTGLYELRPVAKQKIVMETVEIIEPEIIREKRHKEIKWKEKP